MSSQLLAKHVQSTTFPNNSSFNSPAFPLSVTLLILILTLSAISQASESSFKRAKLLAKASSKSKSKYYKMVNFGLVDVVLEFIACGAVLLNSAILAIHWHPLLEQVRESCNAGIAHPGRDRLLYLVGLTPTAWGLALGIYIRNLYLIGCIMAEMPKKHLGHWIISRLLDVYLFFVSFCGSIGLAVTLYYIYTFREDLKDLAKIIRFNPGAHQQLADLELQRLSAGVVAPPNFEGDTAYRGATTFSDNLPRPRSRDTDSPGLDAQRSLRVASQPLIRRHNPILVRGRAYRMVATEGTGGEPIDTPASPSQAGPDNNSRRSSPDTVGRPPSMVSDHGSNDLEPFREASPCALRYQGDNFDEVDECPLSRCGSCSEAHSSTIPHTRRAAVREPLTPTSPTRDYGRSAMWSRVSSSQSGEVQARGTQVPPLAGLDAMPAESDETSAAYTISELGDGFQDELERYDRAVIAASEQGTAMPPETPPTTEPGTSGNTSDRWDEGLGGLNSRGVDGERLITEVDKELGREAQKEYDEFLENRQSLLQNQRILRATDRGQAISAALALQRGTPIPSGPARQLIYRLPGCYPGSNVPRDMLPAPSPQSRRPMPAPQNRPRYEVGSTFPSYGSHSYARPRRVMADQRLVPLGGTDGPATITRVASPRLRLEIPEHTSLVHGRTADESRQRREDRHAVEDWMSAQGRTPDPSGLNSETPPSSAPTQPIQQECHSEYYRRAAAIHPSGNEHW